MQPKLLSLPSSETAKLLEVTICIFFAGFSQAKREIFQSNQRVSLEHLPNNAHFKPKTDKLFFLLNRLKVKSLAGFACVKTSFY